MIRNTALMATVLVLAACPAPEVGSIPGAGSDVVVPDSAGHPFTPSLSPDGTRLAWSGIVDGLAAIFVGNPDGSNPVRLTHGVWDTDPRWSPDGSWIAYYADEDANIWAVPSAGGEPRQLTSGPAQDAPVGWLPDGSAVTFYRRDAGALRTLAVPLDGGPVRPLVPAVAGDQYVAISPDGKRAAFDVHRGGEGTIWVQDLSGGPARQLTTEGLENGTPTRRMWSPDSRHVTFGSRRTGTWDLWTADVETGELRQLTSDIRNDVDYRWSPDGRWIAFRSDRGGQWDLWIVSSEGGEAHRVTNDLSVQTNPDWSADGKTLVYQEFENTSGLQVLPVAGGSGRSLAGWPGYRVNQPEISPDGATVLFPSDRSGNWDIWSVPLAGGEPAPFAASPLDEVDPRFSPDGSQVLFQSNRGGSADLWMMPAAGGEARRLTEWPSAETEGRWSPDGSRIGFISDHDAVQPDVWVMSAGGGEPQRLTRDAGALNLRWSPDGRTLYYVGKTSTGAQDLYKVPVTGGRSQALGASGGIAGGDLSPDGAHFAYFNYLRGWSFTEVIATAGGKPRRLTTDTARVYQAPAQWAPDGSRILVGSYDFPNNTSDLLEVTWPEGVWRSLTPGTPHTEEFPGPFSKDGRDMVITVRTSSSRIMSAPVAGLLTEK